ncbi:MAG: hypothetical protein IPO81_27055 [Kouleothrix sp.]|nr:hypothetical protein [Kouleothrix sp.]
MKSINAPVLATLGLVLLALAGCGAPIAPAAPYAQVESVQPPIPDLQIQATAGMGGELEIVNRTNQEVVLFDERGAAYVRVTPTEVFERHGGVWTKTKDSNVYYCQDPRIKYAESELASGGARAPKRWSIQGQAGAHGFTITGQTIYARSTSLERATWLLLPALGLLALLAAAVAVMLKRRHS